MTTPTDHLEKMRCPQITSVAPILPATETDTRASTGDGTWVRARERNGDVAPKPFDRGPSESAGTERFSRFVRNLIGF